MRKREKVAGQKHLDSQLVKVKEKNEREREREREREQEQVGWAKNV